jgi:hypothetical protein
MLDGGIATLFGSCVVGGCLLYVARDRTNTSEPMEFQVGNRQAARSAAQMTEMQESLRQVVEKVDKLEKSVRELVREALKPKGR